jgi:hypothetical protein
MTMSVDDLVGLVSRPANHFQVGSDHVHVWVRVAGTCGFFQCWGCSWLAVCPGCLGSLPVALRLQRGIVGLGLFWCLCHCGEL